MIYLGGNMASRMDKYYDRRFQNTKRSHRNRLLYEEIDLEIALEKLYDEVILPLNEVAKNGVQKKDKNYDLNTSEQKQLFLDEDKIDVPTNINDYLKIMDDYVKSQNIQPKKVRKLKLHKDQDEKIKELIAIITNTSNLNKSNYKKSKLNMKDYTYYFDTPVIKEKSKINIILDKCKNILKKNNKKSDNSKILPSKGSFEKNETRKLNLKVKYIVGIIFLINSLIIISVVCFAIK